MSLAFFRIIPTSATGVHTRLGKFKQIVSPGIKFKIPILDQIHPITNRLTQQDFECKVMVQDSTVTLGIAMQYLIQPENTFSAFYSLSDPNYQLKSLVESCIRNIVPQNTIEQLSVSQESISDKIKNQLEAKFTEYGYTLHKTLITNIKLAPEVEHAMNKVNASKKLKEAAINEAEANYIISVKDAEADKVRKKLQGEGISDQRLAILSGYENSIENMKQKFGISAEKLVDFVINTQHLDTIETIGKSPNCKTIFLNHEPGLKSSCVLGEAVGSELRKEGLSGPFGSQGTFHK